MDGKEILRHILHIEKEIRGRSAARIVPAQRPFHERYTFKPHNGAQETARRRRQMKRDDSFELYGTFTYSGMMGRWHRNSHGELCTFY